MNNEKPLNIMSWYFGMSAVLFWRIKARYSITKQDKYVCRTNLQHLDSSVLGEGISLPIATPLNPPRHIFNLYQGYKCYYSQSWSAQLYAESTYIMGQNVTRKTYLLCSTVILRYQGSQAGFFFGMEANVSMALILTGKYNDHLTSSNQGTSISGTLSRIKSTRGLQWGAPSTRPMKDALGRPKARQTRSSLLRGSCTSRGAGDSGWARDAVAISCGWWACRIAGWEERRTKMAEKRGREVEGSRGLV
jgi:hypothetical protein